MDTPILEVSGLTKQFGKFTAVDNISFSIKEGEIVGLLGPNGAGKTTTIFMLLNLIIPTSGTIKIFGLEYPSDAERILQNLNYSSTYVAMAPRLTVRENLRIMAKLYQVHDAETKIIALTKKFGVDMVLNAKHRNLSDGQRTRVYLCKAFLNSPRLLLLDEPTASLDPDIAALARKEILEARDRGTTVLLTSHNMAEVEEVCDRVLFIDHGSILAEDSPEQLAKKVRQVRVNFMMTDGQKRMMVFAQKAGFGVQVQGRYVTVSVDEQDIAYLLAGLAEHGAVYREISIDKPTLEDYFLKMTKRRTV